MPNHNTAITNEHGDKCRYDYLIVCYRYAQENTLNVLIFTALYDTKFK